MEAGTAKSNPKISVHKIAPPKGAFVDADKEVAIPKTINGIGFNPNIELNIIPETAPTHIEGKTKPPGTPEPTVNEVANIFPINISISNSKENFMKNKSFIKSKPKPKTSGTKYPIIATKIPPINVFVQ